MPEINKEKEEYKLETDKSFIKRFIDIKDFQDSRLDVYARLSENQLLNRADETKGMFIAESPLVIQRALQAGCIPISILMEKKKLNSIEYEILYKTKDIPIFTAKFDILTQITGYKLTRGMLCAMLRPPLPDLKSLCRNSSRIAVLENVMNPTNIGAIFRNAAALHIDAILLSKDCSNPLYRRAARVSMGTVFQIPWTIINPKNTSETYHLSKNDSSDSQKDILTNITTMNQTNFDKDKNKETSDDKYHNMPYTLDRIIPSLHAYGYTCVSLALVKDSINISDPALKNESKLAIFLGSEGYGLSGQTIQASDYKVMIPMSHGVDSLNVASTSAIAFWELGKNI